MYSLVLMTAMTTAPETTQFNGFFRDLFCGCCGSSSSSAGSYSGNTVPNYSCYGGGSGAAYNAPSGCSGSAYSTSCNGCTGCNGCNGDTFMNRVRRWFESPGCCGGGCCGGGCCGGGCCGGSGSGYNCSGSSSYSCFGAPVYIGYSGQSGMGFEPYPSYPAVPGVTPMIPYAPPESAPALNPQNTGFRPAGYATTTSTGNPKARATVIIKVPADARLYADAKPLNLVGTERKFVSPELPGGQEFTYRFRVEYDRNGETLSVTRKVPVRAGGTVLVEFNDMTVKSAPEKNAGGGGAAVAATPTGNSAGNAVPAVPATTPVQRSDTAPVASVPVPAAPATTTPATTPVVERATIRVKLPPGATLYVDDRRSPSTEPVRQFSTPPLPVGKEFAYLMKAEVVRNGQTETFMQKVPFRAGERVEVDFTTAGR